MTGASVRAGWCAAGGRARHRRRWVVGVVVLLAGSMLVIGPRPARAWPGPPHGAVGAPPGSVSPGGSVVVAAPATEGATTGPAGLALPPGTVVLDPAQALARRDAARRAQDQARAALSTAEARHQQLDRSLSGLGSDQRAAVAGLARAQRRADDAVVAAYIGGGPVPMGQALLGATDAGQLALRSYLVRDQASRLHEAVADARRLQEGADQQVNATAQALVEADRDLEAARQASFASDLALERAERDLRVAELAAALADPGGSRGARPAGSDGSPTPDQTGNAWGPGWDALRRCESGGDYNAVSAQGTYRGAYQFDLRTWAGVGGVGDPIDNTTAEQDYRAQILYNDRGSQPWPICGRYLDLWNAFWRELGLGGAPTPPPVPPPRPTAHPIPVPEVTIPPVAPPVSPVPVPPPVTSAPPTTSSPPTTPPLDPGSTTTSRPPAPPDGAGPDR